MMKQLLTTTVLCLTLLSSSSVWAHGDAKAKYGGVVATASDFGFELVATATGAALYVEDHGKPMAPSGLSGKLTVLNGAEKSEAALVVSGARLEAQGVKLGPGAKVVAAITTAGKKTITVRFKVK